MQGLFALLPVFLFGYFLSFLPRIVGGETFAEQLDWVPGLGLRLSFYLDGLSLTFALLITGVGALVIVYAASSLEGHPGFGRFFGFLLTFMGAMLGLVLSRNLLLVFAFWELTSLSSYFLIGFEHERARARSAALQALLVTGAGGLALLAGFLLIGQAAGSFELALSEAAALSGHSLYLPILLLVVAGAFTKSAQFPFHFWLPSAMEAPTPVSAYLHSSTMVKAGIYLLARLAPVLGGTDAWFWLLVLSGGATMLAGAYLALQEPRFKRLLAYSTISALGTVTMLLGIGTAAAVQAAVVFLLVHAAYKGALFLVAGTIIHETGETHIDLLRGVSRTLPMTAAAGILAALSMAGIPPFFGFVGKELLYEAGLAAGGAVTFVVVSANVCLVAVAGRLILGLLRGSPIPPAGSGHGASMSLGLPPLLLGAAGLLATVVAPALGTGVVGPAVEAIRPSSGAPGMALFHGITPALLLDMLGLAAGAALFLVLNPVNDLHRRLASILRWNSEGGYTRALGAIFSLAAMQTRILQNGYLRAYISIIVGASLSLIVFAILAGGGVSVPDLTFGSYHYEVVLGILIICAALAAVRARSRIVAVTGLGVVGYLVALVYVVFGAPDLAITQFVIDTFTLILFVLVFLHLPRATPLDRAGRSYPKIIVAVAAGVLMTGLVLVAVGFESDASVSAYFVENSLGEGHGRNIVNVILVDFRAIDTLGEITVLAIAALGVWAVWKLRPEGEKN